MASPESAYLPLTTLPNNAWPMFLSYSDNFETIQKMKNHLKNPDSFEIVRSIVNYLEKSGQFWNRAVNGKSSGKSGQFWNRPEKCQSSRKIQTVLKPSEKWESKWKNSDSFNWKYVDSFKKGCKFFKLSQDRTVKQVFQVYTQKLSGRAKTQV